MFRLGDHTRPAKPNLLDDGVVDWIDTIVQWTGTGAAASIGKEVNLRVKNAISDLILVDGVGPDFSVAGFARQVRAAIDSAATVDTKV
jgi:hypothetical protein